MFFGRREGNDTVTLTNVFSISLEVMIYYSNIEGTYNNQFPTIFG